jgi:DNA topoisomerase-3
VKNYDFQFDFGRPWGNCQVTMTSVLGHLTGLEFNSEYKQWSYPPPERLFSAKVETVVPEVSWISVNQIRALIASGHEADCEEY